jgi:hypothetical protein
MRGGLWRLGLGVRVGGKQDVDCLIIFETGKTIHLRRCIFFWEKMFDNDDFFGLQFFYLVRCLKKIPAGTPTYHITTYILLPT